MTAKDIQRIEAARKLNPIDWGQADAWAKEADTLEAREELLWIGKVKYRAEEASLDML